MKNITFNNSYDYLHYQKMTTNALKHYMLNNSFSINQISKLTTLSHSTIRSILNGKSFSWRSFAKLLTLGKDFTSYFNLRKFKSRFFKKEIKTSLKIEIYLTIFYRT